MMAFEKVALRAVRAIDRVIDLLLGIVLCIMLLFGVYALWDSQQVYDTADAANYAAYRPDAEDTLSFDELRAMNPEVFAWLTVNDTPIDYPLTQADSNQKYVNTNAKGEYSLVGAIFLDCKNSRDFDDFNSIIYGHHMEKKMMFGSLSDFEDKAYFDSHPYGNLFFNGADHGIEFFAFILTDAYDTSLFTPAVEGADARQAYLDRVLSGAIHTRDIPVSADDQILLLSTCTSVITNGRYILVGKLSEELHLQEKETEPAEKDNGSEIDTKQTGKLAELPVWIWLALAAVLVVLLVMLRRLMNRKSLKSKG